MSEYILIVFNSLHYDLSINIALKCSQLINTLASETGQFSTWVDSTYKSTESIKVSDQL